MKNKKIVFILISIFCIFALGAGIYAQFFQKRSNNVIQNSTLDEKNDTNIKTQEEIKNQFKTLFKNKLSNNNHYDTTNIKKIDESKEIVYSAYDVQKKSEQYEIDIHLPVVNIKNEVANNFNIITKEIFANEANKVIKNEYKEKIIYNVNYVANINDKILSLAIESTFKQGDKPQRVIIQTYNYNLETEEKIELQDLLTIKNIIKTDCQNKINQVINKAKEETDILVKAGYTVYNRELSNEMYKLSNISKFFFGVNNELYIIFAYGNQNYTSEMDIVLYE